MTDTLVDNHSKLPTYSLSGHELNGEFDHSNPQEISIPKKAGLAEVFSKDTLEIKNDTVDAKKAEQIPQGWLSWLVSLFGPATITSIDNDNTKVVGSLEPTLEKPASVDPDQLEKVMKQLNAVNERMKEFNEEVNLDKQFIEMHLALTELKKDLANSITGDVHQTFKANREKKKETTKKLDDLIDAGRKKGWANMAQSTLAFLSLVATLASILRYTQIAGLASPVSVISQLLATVTGKYYEIKQKSLESANITDQAEINRMSKKIEGLLGELKAMTDSVYKTQQSTATLLKNHQSAASSILQ